MKDFWCFSFLTEYSARTNMFQRNSHISLNMHTRAPTHSENQTSSPNLDQMVKTLQNGSEIRTH